MMMIAQAVSTSLLMCIMYSKAINQRPLLSVAPIPSLILLFPPGLVTFLCRLLSSISACSVHLSILYRNQADGANRVEP